MEGKCCGKYWDEKLGYVLFKDGEFCGFSTNYDKDYQTGGSLGQYPVALVKLPSGKNGNPQSGAYSVHRHGPNPGPSKRKRYRPQRFPKVRNDCGDTKRKFIFSNA